MNLIVICLDTLRADMIPHPDVETPNMEAFAKESVNFTRAFGEVGPTIQMRRSFFTGMRSLPF